MSASDVEHRQSWLQQQRFLEAFAASGSVGQACLDTATPAGTVDSWASRDTHSFKKRKAEAARIALGHYEREIQRRAIEGVDHPVIYQGVITDTYKQYSDNLLMFRVKRLDPEYRDTGVPDSKPHVQITKIVVHVPPGLEAAPSAGAGQAVEAEVRELPPGPAISGAPPGSDE